MKWTLAWLWVLWGPVALGEGREGAAQRARGAAVAELFRAAGVEWPPGELYLRAFKQERELEVWAGAAGKPLVKVNPAEAPHPLLLQYGVPLRLVRPAPPSRASPCMPRRRRGGNPRWMYGAWSDAPIVSGRWTLRPAPFAPCCSPRSGALR